MKIITLDQEHGNIESSFNFFIQHNIHTSSKILDIGCNYGSLIYNLYVKGYKNVIGIDINKKSIEIGREKYSDIKENLTLYNGENIEFPDEIFDVVLMFDVIEHIPNVHKFLKNEVCRVLKKGGQFIFQTPNRYTNIIWEIINHRSLTKWQSFHCSLQTYWSLKELLKESGLNIISIEKYNINTKHNIGNIGRKLGTIPAKIILKIISTLPLPLSSNFWGISTK